MLAVLYFEQTPSYLVRLCSSAHRVHPQSCTKAEKGSECKNTAFLLFSCRRIPHDHKRSNLIRIKDYCHHSSACHATVRSQITFPEQLPVPAATKQGGKAELWVRGRSSYM